MRSASPFYSERIPALAGTGLTRGCLTTALVTRGPLFLMKNKNIRIPLGTIEVSASESDADLGRRADGFLPEALRKIGEEMAKEAWDTLQQGFSGIEGFKPNTSASEKSTFMRETAQEYVRKANAQEKHEVREHLLAQLKELRAKAS